MVEEDIEFVTFDGVAITKSDIRDEIINMYIEAGLDGMTKITDFTVGSEAYHLADVMASFILEHREMIDTNYRMSMIHTAEGEFLDNFGDMVGVHRIASSPSEGMVTFTRLGTDTSRQIVIPDGSQVATEDAISFLVDNEGEDLVLESGATTLDANVLCEQEGAYTNVNPNTVTLVLGDLGHLVSVDNAAAFTGGTDIELDDDYRARILLSPYEVPVGTLAWYENVSLGIDSVHDVNVYKGTTALEDDVNILFNPVDWTDTVVREDINQYNEDNDIESTATATMTKARADLVDTFQMKEYDVIGVTIAFQLCEKVEVLTPTDSVNYLFAVLLETDYTLTMVKQAIIDKINGFNSDAMIGNECNPNTLASIIENEVEGVSTCRIVKYEDGSYTEIVEPISVEYNELAQIDTTDIGSRIAVMSFNIDITLED